MENQNLIINLDASFLQTLTNQIVASNFTGVYFSLLREGRTPEEAMTEILNVYGSILNVGFETRDDLGHASAVPTEE